MKTNAMFTFIYLPEKNRSRENVYSCVQDRNDMSVSHGVKLQLQFRLKCNVTSASFYHFRVPS